VEFVRWGGRGTLPLGDGFNSFARGWAGSLASSNWFDPAGFNGEEGNGKGTVFEENRVVLVKIDPFSFFFSFHTIFILQWIL
jgi:hypothetical protein